jgi:hypothetical protein
LIKYIFIFTQIIAIASCAIADPKIQTHQVDHASPETQHASSKTNSENTDQKSSSSNIEPAIISLQKPDEVSISENASTPEVTTNKKSVLNDNSPLNPPILKPYTAKYEATWKAGWFPITIEATRTLEKLEGNNWKVSFEAYSSVADLSEISEFSLSGNQIFPVKYRYKTSGFLSKKLRNLEFNREENKVWLPYKDTWGNYELTDSIQDHLSYQEQIRLDLISGKSEFSYPVAYKNRLKQYDFSIVGKATLKMDQGNIETIEIKQIKSKDKESTHIWLAKDYDFLIVKLQTIESNGVSQTLKLKQAIIGNKKLSGL